MQDILEELIRWVGYSVLWLVTFGRYRGGTTNDRLPEGAVGLAFIIGGSCLAYVLKF